MGARIGPVRRRVLGRTGVARRLRKGHWSADAEAITSEEARRREEAVRLQDEDDEEAGD